MTKKKRGLGSNPLFTKTDQDEAQQSSENEQETVAEDEERDVSTQNTQNEETAPESQKAESSESDRGESSNQSTDQSTSHSTDEPTDESTDQPEPLSTRNIVPRPKAFYLYEDQINDLDQLIERLKKQHKVSTDRSALLRAILTEPVLNYHDETTHRELIDRLLRQAANRMIG